jgi:hypothetical protein
MTYTPIALPSLPRKRCPGEYQRSVTRYGSKRDFYMVPAPCKAAPLKNGWCKEHQHCLALLEQAARLGFPRVQVSEGLWIGEGVGNWEVYAVHHPLKRQEQVMKALLKLEERERYERATTESVGASL